MLVKRSFVKIIIDAHATCSSYLSLNVYAALSKHCKYVRHVHAFLIIMTS